MIAYHYSLEVIQPGSIILSHQKKLAKWPIRYKKYRLPYVKAAAKLGFALPYEFGYAYREPELRGKGLIEYVVEAADADVMVGNRIYSLHAAISSLLKKTRQVEHWAHCYFNAGDFPELVSDKFVVVDVLNIPVDIGVQDRLAA